MMEVRRRACKIAPLPVEPDAALRDSVPCRRLDAEQSDKILAPTVHFRYGRKHVEKELAEFAAKLNVTRRARRPRRHGSLCRAGRLRPRPCWKPARRPWPNWSAPASRRWCSLAAPYNIYDRSVNCDIPRKLRQVRRQRRCRSTSCRSIHEDITDVNSEHVLELRAPHPGRRAASASGITNLHWSIISNFKCGPDSYIKSFVDEAAGKPSSCCSSTDTPTTPGFITRCEAYLDSKGFLRCVPIGHQHA